MTTLKPSLISGRGQNKIRRVVVFGHSGFIGRHLEKAFEALCPEIEIIRKSLPTFDLTKREDVKELSHVFNLETAVIMAAAIKRQFGDTIEVFEKNLSMTSHLCQVLENHPVGHFIFFSSSAVYGEDIHDTHITEETRVCPTSYYGIVKYTAERMYTKTISRQKETSLVILRPPLIYGPGDLGKTYGPAGFIQAAVHKEPIVLWGDGTELREFIFVDDIVRIVGSLLSNDFHGIINIASGKSYTFQDALKIIARYVENLDIVSKPRTKDKIDNAFDNKRFRQWMPGFQFTSLEEGIRKTFNAHIRLNETVTA